MGRGTDRFVGVLYVLSAVILVVAVVVGTLDGRGPNPVLAIVLAAGVVGLLALAAASLGPPEWGAPAMRVVNRALMTMWLLIGVTALVLPGWIADPHSSRGPTTDSAARWMGAVMLAAAALPWVVLWLAPRLARAVRWRR
jgi:hypothetical protein